MLETKTLLIGTLKELNDYFYDELGIKDTSKNDTSNYVECSNTFTVHKQLDLISSSTHMGKVLFIEYHTTPDNKRVFTLMGVYVSIVEYDDKNINDIMDKIHTLGHSSMDE
jgi:hypothetical protein